MAEEIKQKQKLEELKKRFRQVEGENDLLQEKLHGAQKSIKRLRLERSILLERIEKGFENSSDSDTGSDLLSNNDLISDKTSAHHHHHKHHKQTEKNIGATTVIKPPKKKKDPNAPKGPGNVFFLFCRQERDKIKEEFPEESIGDVTKLLGLKWKGLAKDEKMVYYDLFKKEMDEYDEAMKVYKSTLPLDEDPVEDLAMPESLVSSPVSTNTDIIMQQQEQQEHQTPQDTYQQTEHVYAHRPQTNYIVDNSSLLYDPRAVFMFNNQENRLQQERQHHPHPHPHRHHDHHHPIQQQPLQSSFVIDDNNNAFEKPVIMNPPSAPYDHF